jgi:hypothetical protein
MHERGTDTGKHRRQGPSDPSWKDRLRRLSYLAGVSVLILAMSYVLRRFETAPEEVRPGTFVQWFATIATDLLRDCGLLVGAIGVAHFIAEAVLQIDFAKIVSDRFNEAFATFNLNYELAKECQALDIVHIFKDRESVVTRVGGSDLDLLQIIEQAHTIKVVTTWFRDGHPFNDALEAAISNSECTSCELAILAPESSFLEERIICTRAASDSEPWEFGRNSLDRCLAFLNKIPSVHHHKVRLYLYDLMPWCDTVVINDTDAFLSPYPPTTFSHDAPHFQVKLKNKAGLTAAGKWLHAQLEQVTSVSWIHPSFKGEELSPGQSVYSTIDYPIEKSVRPKRAGIIRVHPDFPAAWAAELLREKQLSRAAGNGARTSELTQICIVTTWFFDDRKQKENVLKAIRNKDYHVRLFMLHPASAALAMRARQTGVSFREAVEGVCETLKDLHDMAAREARFSERVEVRLYEELPSAPIFECTQGSPALVTRLVGHYGMFSTALEGYFIYTRQDGFLSNGRRDLEKTNASLSNFVHDQITQEIERLGDDKYSSKVDLNGLRFQPAPRLSQREAARLKALQRRYANNRKNPTLHYALSLETSRILTSQLVRHLPELQHGHLPTYEELGRSVHI